MLLSLLSSANHATTALTAVAERLSDHLFSAPVAHFDNLSVQVATVLVGAFAFLMSVFYLVNNKDHDIKRSTWMIINGIVSVFLAIHIYHLVNSAILSLTVPHVLFLKMTENNTESDYEKLVDKFGADDNSFLVREKPKSKHVDLPDQEDKFHDAPGASFADKIFMLRIEFTEAIVWFVVMNLFVGYCCGAFWRKRDERDPEPEKIWAKLKRWALWQDAPNVVPVAAPLDARRKEENQDACNVWGCLLTHIATFASMNVFCSVQSVFFSENAWYCYMCCFLLLGFCFVIFGGLQFIRKVLTRATNGERDDREEMWHEEMLNNQVDVASVGIAFLFVQAIQFSVVGVLPNYHGEQPSNSEKVPYFIPPRHDYVWMFGICFGTFLICLFTCFKVAEFCIQRKGTFLGEFAKLANLIVTLIFGWSLLLSCRWFVALQSGITDPVIFKTAIAVVLSAIVIAIVFYLDADRDEARGLVLESTKIERKDTLARLSEQELGTREFGDLKISKNEPSKSSAAPSGGNTARREALTDAEVHAGALETIISCLGVVIGFGFEHAFNVATAAVNQELSEKGRTEFGKEHGINLSQIFLDLILIMIILPAWAFYIVPKVTLLTEEEEMGVIDDMDLDEENEVRTLIFRKAQDEFDDWKHKKKAAEKPQSLVQKYWMHVYAGAIVFMIGVIVIAHRDGSSA